MPSIKSRYIKVGNLKIRYYLGGQGEPLLIIHGGNSHAKLWVKNMRELYQNHTIYVPDLPGFGLSQAMEGNFYVPELVDFIDKFAQAVGLESFHLMGHSLGGAIAASYAFQYPKKVSKLVLMDSMCFGEEIALWVRVLSLPAFCSSVGKGLVALFQGVKWLTEATFRSMDFIIPISQASIIIGSSSVTLHTQTVVLIQRLSEIIAPTLVIWGENDRIVPVKQAYAAATVIPDCQLKVFEDCGHSAYQQRLPEFSQLVIRFLEK
jgi:4,5:9,10-diseco-3-hydroxy-5,9,17-trioxoandrosta-1(10),2-diene-4-oate hydrolase